jgi:hypothetical protein
MKDGPARHFFIPGFCALLPFSLALCAASAESKLSPALLYVAMNRPGTSSPDSFSAVWATLALGSEAATIAIQGEK